MICFLGAACISFFGSLFSILVYCNIAKKKKKNSIKFLDFVVVAIILLTVFMTVTLYTEYKNFVLVSTGIAVVLVMCISKCLILFCIKKKKDGSKQEDDTDYISVLYLIALIDNAVICLFYLKQIELFLTYLAIILGKFIWFDIKSFSDIYKENKEMIQKGSKDLWNNHRMMFLYEVIVLTLITVGLVLQLLDKTNKAQDILYGLCTGVFFYCVVAIWYIYKRERNIKQDIDD